MKKYIIILLSVVAVAALCFISVVWFIFFKPNISSGKAEKIFISTGSGYNAVVDSLMSKKLIKNKSTFAFVSGIKHYKQHVKPGCYVVKPGMGNYRIIKLLISGKQTPVKVTFNNVRTLSDLAKKVGGQIEADSLSMIKFLNNPENYSHDGFTHENIISVFIPDTYEVYWTSTPDEFYKRMLYEFKSYWNSSRIEKAKTLNLKPLEVSTLASIIDDEVNKNDEKPRIAGVYLNRLRIGMPLQACPTIKFALNDFTIKRVLDEYLKVESPYNTYKYKGLPPGPVRCPTKAGIEAVLNAEKHDYLYFAAKADFSGYHNFSRTLAEHNRYAEEYHRELNKRKIFE